VPGFTLVQHGSEGKGHQFFLRGFDAVHGADLELSVDGIPINEWSNIHAQGYIDLGFVIAEVIESVEVHKGPFNLEQGPFAMAGSASYRLGVPLTDLGLRTTYSLGTTNRQRGVVTFSPPGGDGREFIAVEALHDDGFGQRRQAQRGSLLGRVRLLDSAAYGSLAWLGSAYFARFQLPGSLRNEDAQTGRVGFYDAYDHGANGSSGRALTALSYEQGEAGHGVQARLFGGYRRLDVLENFTGFLFDPVAGDRRAQAQSSWSLGVAASWDARLLETLTVSTGLGARAESFDQVQRHVDAQALPLETERALNGLQSLMFARAGLGWWPSDGFNLVAGGRLDVAGVAVQDAVAANANAANTLAALSPRLMLQARVVEGWWAFAAYGRGFRPPEARAFSSFAPERTGISEELDTGGQPTMTISDALDWGVRWDTGALFAGRLSGFATFIERESVFDHVSGLSLELNGTRRLGAELELQSSPERWLELSADATVVDARFVESGNQVPLTPWLSGGLRAIVTHDNGFHAGLRLLGLAPRPLPHGARGAPLLLTDATLGYRWARLRLDLELENFLSLRLREGEYHYASHWRPGEPSSQIPVLHYVAGPPFNARLSVTAVF
jgi:outer membrane receptor protein involved in Fe transport